MKNDLIFSFNNMHGKACLSQDKVLLHTLDYNTELYSAQIALLKLYIVAEHTEGEEYTIWLIT